MLTSRCRPADNVAIFITIIVKMPILQIMSMILGFVMIAMELPAPPFKGTALGRSLVLRAVMLLFITLVNSLYYQVRSASHLPPRSSRINRVLCSSVQGINAAIYALIAALCYARGIMLGETMEEAKENRGRGGRA